MWLHPLAPREPWRKRLLSFASSLTRGICRRFPARLLCGSSKRALRPSKFAEDIVEAELGGALFGDDDQIHPCGEDRGIATKNLAHHTASAVSCDGVSHLLGDGDAEARARMLGEGRMHHHEKMLRVDFSPVTLDLSKFAAFLNAVGGPEALRTRRSGGVHFL